MLKLPQAVRGSVPEMRMRENMKKGGRFIAGLTSEALLISQYEGEKGSLQPIQRTSATVPVAEGDRVIVSMTTVSTHKVSKAALVEIEFSDQNGSPVDFVWNSSPSNFGAFQYIDVQEPGEHATTQFALDAPAGAATLKILGHNWNRYVRTRVVGEIRVQNLNVPQKTQSISEQTTYPAINLLIKRPVPGKASSVRISVDHSAAGEQSANPVVVKWRDEYGTELMPPCDLAQHPKHGAYFVLKGQQNSVENTTIEIDIPKSVAQIEIQGLNWGAKSALIHGVPVLEFVEDPLARVFHGK